MTYRARLLRLAGVLAVLGVLAVPLSAAAQDDEHGAYVMYPFATGLTSPRGLAFDENGHLLVASLGTGNFDGSVWRLTDLDGNGMADNGAEMKVALTGLPSSAINLDGDVEIAGPSGIAVSGSDIYVIEGGLAEGWPSAYSGTLWSTAAPNHSTNPLWVASPYANISAYEWAHNPANDTLDSNPYEVAVDSDGTAYVNDAGGNATYMVGSDGSISVFAVWPQLPNPLPFGPPDVDPVPTAIAIGPDGVYVSFLTGFPFPEGGSSIYRLSDNNGDGDAMDDGEMEMVADGLTTVTALAWDMDGHLLATEFRGFLTAQSPDDPIDTGDVVMWHDDHWHTIADHLVTPTGLAVGPDGTIYVSMEFAGVIMQIHEMSMEGAE